MDYMIEPENKLIRFGPEVVHKIRKEFNIDKKETREEAIAIIDRWLKTQDHIVKKDFSKDYIERCIITSKGSIERAKIQIDKLCTLRTLLPKYFQITNVLESEIAVTVEKGYLGLVPTLTPELFRVVILKVKPNTDTKSSDITNFFSLIVIMAEYLKSNDYCLGFKLIVDILDTSAADVLTKINLIELQQFVPVITEGFGTKIKGITFLTASKFIDGFVRLVKPVFSEKIGSRINVVTTKAALHKYFPEECLPEDYGGKAESAEILHENLMKALNSKQHQELLKEMNKACTDESKRQRDKFNEKYMGMPGTFRILSLD